MSDSTVQLEDSVAFDETKQLAFLGWILRDQSFFIQAVRIVKADWFVDPFARKAYKALLEIHQTYHRIPEATEVALWRGLADEDSKTRLKIEQTVARSIEVSMGYGLDIIKADMENWLSATLFVEMVQKSVPAFNSKRLDKAWDLIDRALLRRKTSSFADGVHQGFSPSEQNILLERNERKRQAGRMLEYGNTYLDDLLCGIRPTELIILGAKTGCHAAGQGIRMFDGSVKPVEEIGVGDLLMGPDSKKRVVTGLIRGLDQIYEIVPVKGDRWTATGEHVLKVVGTNDNEIRFVTVEDFLNWPVTHRKHSKLLRSSGVEYPTRELSIDPYFLGILLGDGTLSQNTIGVTTLDKEILEEVKKQAEIWGSRVSKFDANGTRCPTYYLPKIGHKSGGERTALRRAIFNLGLEGKTSEDKFIPNLYKIGSRDQRLQLLAGLMDTDGSLSLKGFDFISKSKRLSQDVCEVARSLGLAAYIMESKKKAQTGPIRTYWRVSISGNTEIIPCKLDRKRAKTREQIKSVNRTGFSVEKLSIDKFYGFELSGDGQYLLADFTETHNSGKTQLSLSIALHNASRGKRVHFFALEADQYEIERRIKYQILSNYYYSKGNHRHIDYGAWLAGELEDVLGPLEDELEGQFKDAVKNLNILYRKDGTFGVDALREELLALVGNTDLIILDHLHYIDTEGDEDNKVYAECIKAIRDIVLKHEIPVIVVCHLRKDATSRGKSKIVPGLEDFHGTSNIVKIATTCIMLGRAYDQEPSAPGHYLQPTYMRVCKSRMEGGRTYFIALTEFNNRINSYEPIYKLGIPQEQDTSWKQLEEILPFQKRLARVLASSN